MATFDYASLRGAATELIAEFGLEGTITRTIKGTRASGGKFTGNTTSVVTVNMFVDNWTTEELRNTKIQKTSKKILIDPVVDEIFVPSTGDVINIQGTDYKIGEIITEQPADVALLYTAEGEIG